MSRLPQSSTIRTEDFPAEVRKWVPRLLTPLNLFITSVINLLNGNLTFVDNIPAQDLSFNFTYASNPQRFTWNNSRAPKIVWIGMAFENGNAFVALPLWGFDASTQIVSLDFKKTDGSALTPGSLYKIFVRVVP